MRDAAIVSWLVIGSAAAAAGVYWCIRWHFDKKNRVISEYENRIDSLNYEISLISESKNTATQQAADSLSGAKARIDELRSMCGALSRREAEAQQVARAAEMDRQMLEDFNRNVISRIRAESALLPSVIQWADRIQEMMDARNTGYLLTKTNPAYKAHEAVMEAKADARSWKRKAEAFRNQIALYEAEAPWLAEILEYSVDDVIQGLEILEAEKIAQSGKSDPASMYIPASDWLRLSESARNQIALDRYFESRQKSAWLAGILYERFVGYCYEERGYEVIYQGALKGVEDHGFDLICHKNNQYTLIQCKRLSEKRGIPVRENAVAQLYGSALVYARRRNIPFTDITCSLVTSYALSDDAKIFADTLNIDAQENTPFSRYPAIKCNVGKSGERIYHLPFDQQYDVTKINQEDGDCWASTVAEAEKRGFRRAYRWTGA